jgi:hypothetical protein
MVVPFIGSYFSLFENCFQSQLLLTLFIKKGGYLFKIYVLRLYGGYLIFRML